MDLHARKYQIIEDLFHVKEPTVLEELENILKKVKDISDENKQILDERLLAFEQNPTDLLNWNDIKNHW